MKATQPLSIAIFLTILVLSAYHRKERRDNHNEVMVKMDSIQQAIERRDYLDSLTYDHLKDCSFIDKGSVSVGHNGYLFSKYHRDEQITN